MLHPVAQGVLAVLVSGLVAGLPAGAAVLGGADDLDTKLRSAHPAPGAEVTESPRRIDLVLDPPWTRGSTVSVSVHGPDDRDLARGLPTATADGISQHLARAPENGPHQVTYRVRTAEGELVSGSYWFIYTPPGLVGQRRVAVVGGLALLGAPLVLLLVRRRRDRPRLDEVPAGTGPGARLREQPSFPRVPRQRAGSDVSQTPPPPPSEPGPSTGRSRRGRGADSSSGRSLGNRIRSAHDHHP